jgi:hypothetical protein
MLTIGCRRANMCFMSKQHTQPCRECPWQRKSWRGWLGKGNNVAYWLDKAHNEVAVCCHMKQNAQCAGIGIYRGNVGKLPKFAEVMALPPDKVKVFASPMEFIAHHERSPRAK